MEFIDLKTQYAKYQTEIDARMKAVLNHGHFIMGPEIAELETALAKYVGVKHCLTVASGTVSLEIALRALGVGQGDEVITVPFTWISSAEVIGLVGAKPVFVDIEPVSYNLDIDKLEAAITPRTKAIMPVSLFGQMPDYDRINAIAAKYNLPVIEDGAQSFGATQNGRRSCGVTHIGSTSFFPAKPLGCYGDGGALFTNDDALAEKMRAIRTHGGLKRHHHPLLGMNGRFDTLQAAVILAKLPQFQAEVEARARIGARYTTLLASGSTPSPLPTPCSKLPAQNSLLPAADSQPSTLNSQLTPDSHLPSPLSELATPCSRLPAPCSDLQSPPSALRPPSSDLPAPRSMLHAPCCIPGNTHVYAQYTIRVSNREALGAKLKEKGIPTAVYYPKCLHEQPVFASSGNKLGDFPVSEQASREVISLPMHPFLTEPDQDQIIAAIQSALSPNL